MTHKAKVLALLSDGCYHSYREGYALNVMLHSRVADLRRDGYDIECKKHTGGYWYRLLSKPAPQGPLGEKALAISNAVTGGSSSGELEGRNPSAWGFRPSSPSGSTSGGADGLTAVPAGHTAGASAPPEQIETLGARGKPGRSSVTQSARSQEGYGRNSPASTAPPSAVSEDAAAGDIPSTSPALAAAQPSLFEMPKVAPWA